ncbi:GntR family transcriptional regulator [Shigella flexneri]
MIPPNVLSDDVACRVRAPIEAAATGGGHAIARRKQAGSSACVSRNSLREALAKLVSEGLLLSRRGGRTFVRWQHEGWSIQYCAAAENPACR